MPFPEINVRCDVHISGPQLEEALLLFIDLVLSDTEELATTPVYFVEGVAIMDPPSFDTHQGTRTPLYMFYSAQDLQERSEEFEKAAMRLVLGNKVLCTSVMLLLEVPSEESASSGSGSGSGSRAGFAPRDGGTDAGPGQRASSSLRYEVAHKTYYLHHSSLQDQPHTLSAPRTQTTHYGTLPCEALYGGYFTESAAARRYLELYDVSTVSSSSKTGAAAAAATSRTTRRRSGRT
ncbi:MAG: hypothetical protein WDW38_009788 [Sanguina aurantia]